MVDFLLPKFSAVDQSFTIRRATPIVMRVPCAIPVQTSFGTMFDRPALFLEIEDNNGNKGLGEVWCNFPVCGAEHRARLLETTILPSLVDVEFSSPAQCFSTLQTNLPALPFKQANLDQLRNVFRASMWRFGILWQTCRDAAFSFIGRYQ